MRCAWWKSRYGLSAGKNDSVARAMRAFAVLRPYERPFVTKIMFSPSTWALARAATVDAIQGSPVYFARIADL